MRLSAEEFLEKTGLGEALSPGQIKYKHHVGEKPGTSYTMVYDWKTDPNKIRVELRPGLTGLAPDKKDLGKYAVWLQSETYLELDLLATKH
jgi:hypothetical protein